VSCGGDTKVEMVLMDSGILAILVDIMVRKKKIKNKKKCDLKKIFNVITLWAVITLFGDI
jgi:hypothetical protein